MDDERAEVQLERRFAGHLRRGFGVLGLRFDAADFGDGEGFLFVQARG